MLEPIKLFLTSLFLPYTYWKKDQNLDIADLKYTFFHWSICWYLLIYSALLLFQLKSILSKLISVLVAIAPGLLYWLNHFLLK